MTQGHRVFGEALQVRSNYEITEGARQEILGTSTGPFMAIVRRTMDPASIITTVGRLSTTYGIKKLLALTTQAKYEAALQQMVTDTVFEVEAAVIKLDERLKRIERENPAGTERFAPPLTEEQFAALFARLFPEAVLATTRERRKLMATAIAGIITPDVSLEEKSRVARALAGLEPSDVLHLRVFVKEMRVPDAEIRLWQKLGRGEPHSQTALENAGCLVWREGRGMPGGYLATPLGKAVVKYLEDWSPTDSVPQEPPATPAGSGSVPL